jgi:hypothetical protein
MPDWLLELSLEPLWFDFRKSIVAPEHIGDALKAFGKKDNDDRRFIASQLSSLVMRLRFARSHRVPMKFGTADPYLARLENATINLHSLWMKASPLHRGLLSAMTATLAPEEANKLYFEHIDPAPVLVKLLLAISALRNPKNYRKTFFQPDSDSRKSLERAVLWEPLLDLMNLFHIQDFSQHQPLVVTIRALHLACDIHPPDPGAVRQTVHAWRKRHR